MKKYSIFFLGVFICIACNKSISPNEVVENSVQIAFTSEKPLYDDATKTEWTGSQIEWSEGDRVKLGFTCEGDWGRYGQTIYFKDSDILVSGGEKAAFKLSSTSPWKWPADKDCTFYGIYPASVGTSANTLAPLVNISLPTQQNPRKDSFSGGSDIMLGHAVEPINTSSGSNLEIPMIWERVVAHAVVTFSNIPIHEGEKIVRATLTFQDGAVATGETKYDIITGVMENVADPYNMVVARTKDCELQNNSLTVWFSIYPLHATSISVELLTEQGLAITGKISNCSLDFKRNCANTLTMNMSKATREEEEDVESYFYGRIENTGTRYQLDQKGYYYRELLCLHKDGHYRYEQTQEMVGNGNVTFITGHIGTYETIDDKMYFLRTHTMKRNYTRGIVTYTEDPGDGGSLVIHHDTGRLGSFIRTDNLYRMDLLCSPKNSGQAFYVDFKSVTWSGESLNGLFIVPCWGLKNKGYTLTVNNESNSHLNQPCIFYSTTALANTKIFNFIVNPDEEGFDNSYLQYISNITLPTNYFTCSDESGRYYEIKSVEMSTYHGYTGTMTGSNSMILKFKTSDSDEYVVFNYDVPEDKGVTKEWPTGTVRIQTTGGYYQYNGFVKTRNYERRVGDGYLTISKNNNLWTFTINTDIVTGKFSGTIQ